MTDKKQSFRICVANDKVILTTTDKNGSIYGFDGTKEQACAAFLHSQPGNKNELIAVGMLTRWVDMDYTLQELEEMLEEVNATREVIYVNSEFIQGYLLKKEAGELLKSKSISVMEFITGESKSYEQHDRQD